MKTKPNKLIERYRNCDIYQHFQVGLKGFSPSGCLWVFNAIEDARNYIDKIANDESEQWMIGNHGEITFR